jgi:CheY-like chemotaxis protein
MSALPKINSTPEPLRLIHADLRPLALLIIDASSVSALALAAAIQQLGGNVAGWSATLQQAIEAIEQVRPDAALIDVDAESSLDAVDCANAILARADVQIVFLAGLIDAATQARIAAVARSRVVAKSILPDELCRIVVEACGSG